MPIQQNLSKSNSFELILEKDHLQRKWLNIKASYKYLFPNINGTTIILITDKGDIHTEFKIYKSRWYPWLEGGDLPIWFDAHKELRVGSKVRITEIAPKIRFRLKIVK